MRGGKIRKVRVGNERSQCVLGLASGIGKTGSGIGDGGGSGNTDIRRDRRRGGRRKGMVGSQPTKTM